MCCYAHNGSKEMREEAHPPIVIQFSKYRLLIPRGKKWLVVFLHSLKNIGKWKNSNESVIGCETGEEVTEKAVKALEEKGLKLNELAILWQYSYV